MRTRHQASRNMQTFAFLWFELQLDRGRLLEAFAEPKLPVNSANLNEPGGSPVRQNSSTPIRRSPGVRRTSTKRRPVAGSATANCER
jgi:hypothetical protein